MEAHVDAGNLPLGGVLGCAFLNDEKKSPVSIIWSNESKIVIGKDSVKYETQNELLRLLNCTVTHANAMGDSPMDKIIADHWLTICVTMQDDLLVVLNYLEQTLNNLTFLVGNKLTFADLAVYGSLHAFKISSYPKNITRWMKLISAQPCVSRVMKSIPPNAIFQTKIYASKGQRTVESRETPETGGRQQEGKFVELPGAEMGKVVVRFPPEASGYLHIGHAKAALLNQYYQQLFKGKLIMRFDDTNPEKENAHFEKVILEDVEMLNIKPDIFSHTSEYFDTMIGMCEQLINQNKAYVDDTPGEQMKIERDQKMESVNRNNSVEKNMGMWNKMKLGTEEGAKCCVRAKIDMQSLNGCMRDPTIYRCKFEEHPRTGFKYKVYPTYDFACPIVDALENVTHVLRTMEYHDRDPQFYWFIDALGLRKPYIWEYSRLNMTNTVLSKRKLTWFVQQGLVDGWDDPRFPTVRGILRRGMTVEGLKQFIIAQGSSRSVVVMEWDKIWSFNKKVIDGIAPRYTALNKEPAPVVVNVKNVNKYESITVPSHPKNSEVGNKTIWTGPKILIDLVDAKLLKEGENCTFINWGNLMINKINKSKNGEIESIDAVTNLDNKDFKKTLKLTWLADTPAVPFTPTYCVFFDHIISKAILAKDEDFKTFIDHTTRTEEPMLGDPSLATLKKGDIIQLQRRGYFKVDVAYMPKSEISGCVQPCILFHIPDGHSKESSQPQVTKSDKKTSSNVAKTEQKVSSRSKDVINNDIVEQGNKIRLLKQQKEDKKVIEAEVKILVALKSEYKDLTNIDWTPDTAVKQTTEIKTSSSKDIDLIIENIAQQGDKIRKLKADKADKKTITEEVQKLLELKKEYKNLTGKEWTVDVKPSENVQSLELASKNPTTDVEKLSSKITEQGNTVRELKSKKASKSEIDVAVKCLLGLKADYKTITGSDWTPEMTPKPQVAETKTTHSKDVNQIIENITQQGNEIRKLKAEKADKKIIDQKVQMLLELKKEYKNQTGTEWTVNVTADTTSKTVTKSEKSGQAELINKITVQGNVVRDLKSKKASKDEVDAAVKVLLSLKAEYKQLTGEDFSAPQQPQKKQDTADKPKQEAKVKKHEKSKEKSASPAPKSEPSAGALKKQTRLGLEAKKESNLPDWYSQVITKGEMIDYYDISGCYILRPWSYSIWDAIRNFLSPEFKKMGVKDCYFPIFVSKAALEREKTHIADFAPEVAWVTKSGESDLAEPIAVRPTSETGMYPAYAKWIQSYRDLPLRLNQWNNVVRWEFQHPQPFLRSREFLWQEGHTAFATKEAADVEVLQVLDLYARVYTDFLAIPVVKGRKTEKEKFAGGDYTTTVEAFVPASGRGIQGATSHHLGQNFAKMFEIIVDDPETQEKRFIYQNSWGITTRTIGVMVMVHGDNQGLVIPPKVAATQVVIVPCGITVSTSEGDRKILMDSCEQLEKKLADCCIQVYGDYRENYSPGWKFNHWELKGVPIRVELGPKDLSQGQFVAVRRDTGVKSSIKISDATNAINSLLDTIQRDMLNKATVERDAHLKKVYEWEEFKAALDDKNILLAPYCGNVSCEDAIKKDSAKVEVEGEQGDGKTPAMGAKALCIPFDQPKEKLPEKCIYPSCTSKTKYFTLFGRSY